MLRAGEAGVRRLAKEMDGAAAAVSELLSESIIPALELALFLLGELFGWAALQAPHSTLGLPVRPTFENVRALNTHKTSKTIPRLQRAP